MGERHIDTRADIYALGAVTYEMLTGDPPFTGSSVQAIVARVMTERPTPPHVLRDTVRAYVEQAVLRALEKLPADRFATAKEFGDALEGRNVMPSVEPARADVARRPGRSGLARLAGAVAAALAVGLIVGWVAHRGVRSAPNYSQRTFDGEFIDAARYAPDGKTIVMTVGPHRDLRVIRPDYPEAELVLPNTSLLAVSSTGGLAVLTHPRQYVGFHQYAMGTLARVPLGGGAPRELVDSVTEADWSPDGSQLAIVRSVGGKERLEYPIGKVLLETAGWFTDLRVSPDGKSIAFADHPFLGDNRGTIATVDLAGHKRTLTEELFGGTLGLAWSRDGEELLFSSRTTTHQMVVFGVTMAGKVREVLNGPGDLTIHDVARTGELLVSHDVSTQRVMAKTAADSVARPVGWQDYAYTVVLSRDGRQLAMSDASTEAGPRCAVWYRADAAGRLARIGEGTVDEFSSDGKWVLSAVDSTPAKLMMYPTGAGTERQIPTPAFQAIDHAEWAPGEQSLLVCGHAGNTASRCLMQGVNGAILSEIPVVESGSHPIHALSPDGRSLLYPEAKTLVWGIILLNDGTRRSIPGLKASDSPVRWSPDGRAVWVISAPGKLERVDIATGVRSPLLSYAPQRLGLDMSVGVLAVADDAKRYAYVLLQSASDLFVVDGVR